MLSLEVRNTDGVIANLRAADRRVQAAVKRVIAEDGRTLLRSAKARAPVRTGRLRRLLRLELTPAGLGYAVGWRRSEFRAERVAFYPVYVTLGTRRQRANPFLRRAFEGSRPRFRRALRDALSAAVARGARGR